MQDVSGASRVLHGAEVPSEHGPRAQHMMRTQEGGPAATGLLAKNPSLNGAERTE